MRQGAGAAAKIECMWTDLEATKLTSSYKFPSNASNCTACSYNTEVCVTEMLDNFSGSTWAYSGRQFTFLWVANSGFSHTTNVLVQVVYILWFLVHYDLISQCRPPRSWEKGGVVLFAGSLEIQSASCNFCPIDSYLAQCHMLDRLGKMTHIWRF